MYTATRDYFEQIAQIPRMSKKEGKIRMRLLNWAEKYGYTSAQDAIGNVVISVPATDGKEQEETIILQAHMDMVCVKDPGSTHNFDEDPIEIVMKGEWMYANQTTLGADNGMGLAMCLAAAGLESHPPLEILVTVDEEQGMSGALELDDSLLSGKKLINLDTEDEGEVCISSSGGGRVDVTYDISRETAQLPVYDFMIQGMQGGHSGVDIDKKRGSAIMLWCEAVKEFSGEIQLVDIEGGVADNAIPGRCKGCIAVADKVTFDSYMQKKLDVWKEKYDCPDIHYSLSESASTDGIVGDGIALLETICSLPVGVHALSEKISGLVQTSVNLGMIAIEDTLMHLTYAPRSSVMKELEALIAEITQLHGSQGATVAVRSLYPGRQEDPNNELVIHVAKMYGEVLGYAPEIVAYHAGLECGALVEKLGEGAQAVSFGPTIKDPHSPTERCHMPSVEKCCVALEKILA